MYLIATVALRGLGRGCFCFYTQLYIDLEFKANYIVIISENNTY